MSTSDSSKRNSLSNEDRPAPKALDLTVSQLMICHFGQELHDRSQSFKRSFKTLYQLSGQTGRSLEQTLPMSELILRDYSALEKMLVLINLVLFCGSLHAENVDEGVKAVLCYFMLAIAYFATTATCLSNAAAFKHRVSLRRPSDPLPNPTFAEDKAATSGTGLSLILPDQLTAPKGGLSKAAAKKQAAGKRSAEPKYLVQAEGKKATPPPPAIAEMLDRKRRPIWRKAWMLVTAITETCAKYGSLLLRVSFFTMNATMLWLALVNLD